MSLSRLWKSGGARVGLGLAATAAAGLGIAQLAIEQRSPPERCPDGMALAGERCCGDGQHLVSGACAGSARHCSRRQARSSDGQCVARHSVTRLRGGDLHVGSADWDGESGAERFPRTRVSEFLMDTTEVTLARFRGCSSCVEPPEMAGLPVRDVTPEQAESFCRRQGGRLPTAAEWVWAAAGADARRYPWGQSGLVCRRAAFGLERGPCAQLAGPELAGSRPDGATPEGLLDLAGNVAEWTREASGQYSARGGSFRSRSAAELKSWAALPDRLPAPYIGFRCAYPP